MGYTETTNFYLRKPTPLTPETEWPNHMNANFDAIDAALAACLRKDKDALPDSHAVRSLGSALLQFLNAHIQNGFFNQITLGGVARSAWPAPGAGSQTMDDTYENGSIVTVDNTDLIARLSAGRKFQITNGDGSLVYLEAQGGVGLKSTRLGSFSRDTSLASGSQSITGVGFKPGAVILLASTGMSTEASMGFDDASTHISLVNMYNQLVHTWAVATSSIELVQTAAIYSLGHISSMDPDGFTIAWTTTGAKTGTAVVKYIAIR